VKGRNVFLTKLLIYCADGTDLETLAWGSSAQKSGVVDSLLGINEAAFLEAFEIDDGPLAEKFERLKDDDRNAVFTIKLSLPNGKDHGCDVTCTSISFDRTPQSPGATSMGKRLPAPTIDRAAESSSGTPSGPKLAKKAKN
jgi:hypothetical protein